MNTDNLDEHFDNPEMFFKDHSNRDTYLRRNDAVDVINQCHIRSLHVTEILPGKMDTESFEPSDEPWEAVCFTNLNSEQVWKSNRDASNFVKTCDEYFNTFILFVE